MAESTMSHIDKNALSLYNCNGKRYGSSCCHSYYYYQCYYHYSNILGSAAKDGLTAHKGYSDAQLVSGVLQIVL